MRRACSDRHGTVALYEPAELANYYIQVDVRQAETLFHFNFYRTLAKSKTKYYSSVIPISIPATNPLAAIRR